MVNFKISKMNIDFYSNILMQYELGFVLEFIT